MIGGGGVVGWETMLWALGRGGGRAVLVGRSLIAGGRAMIGVLMTGGWGSWGVGTVALGVKELREEGSGEGGVGGSRAKGPWGMEKARGLRMEKGIEEFLGVTGVKGTGAGNGGAGGGVWVVVRECVWCWFGLMRWASVCDVVLWSGSVLGFGLGVSLLSFGVDGVRQDWGLRNGFVGVAEMGVDFGMWFEVAGFSSRPVLALR
ncbi:hypothetical protein Tco_0821249 [Tanacetum coccineum]|uniref:Uncharacterized protein n=1 Tax=Tanacetum coccineum TaxID=301880 RepID=A0ABQ5ABR5_9ASTR